MIKPLISYMTALLLLVNTASAQDYCWKQTKTRAVGMIPTDCSYDQQRQGLLCYPKCNAGFTGVTSVCWQDCPAGYFDDGAFCRKTGSYGRGFGFPWQAVDGVSNAGMLARCQTSTAGTCEMWGAIAYPTCKPGYYAAGANICAQGCPAGMTDIGVSCTKQTYMRATLSGQCPAGKTYEDGLCYDSCGAGFTGVGPVCGQKCPASLPYACGAGCAKNYEACVVTTSDQVMNVLSVVTDIGLAVITAGTSYGVKVAAKSTAKTVAEAGVKAAIKAAMKDIGESFSKNMTKEVFVKKIKEQVTSLSEDAINNLYETLSIQGTQAYIAQLDGELPADFDFYSLDPIGIASVVKAYNHAVCPAPAPEPAPPVYQIIPNPPVPRIDLNLPWQSAGIGARANLAIDASVGEDGTVWSAVLDDGQRVDEVQRMRPGGGSFLKVLYSPRGVVKTAAINVNRTVLLTRDGNLFLFDARTGPTPLPGTAIDIAADKIGNLFAIGAQNSLWKLPAGQSVWTLMPPLPADAGTPLRIAAGGVEQVSVVTNLKHYKWVGPDATRPDTPVWSAAVTFPSPLKDAAVGADGSVWAITAPGDIVVNRGGTITRLPDVKNPATGQLLPPVNIFTGSNGKVFVVTQQGFGIYKFSGNK
jgi:hypothetical protein